MLPDCRKEQRWIRTEKGARCRMSPGRLSFFLTYICFTAFDVCKSSPLEPMSSTAVSGAVDFLTKYGYLPQSDLKAGNLRTEKQLKEAIKTMQRFGNIPQTGVIDKATIALMKKPRCGMPDLIGTSERVKRYAIHGYKWKKVDLTWGIKRPVPVQDVQMLRRLISGALKVWSDDSKLTFREIGGDNADIMISFVKGSHGDAYPFDGRGNVLAHAYFPGEGMGGDSHFDADEYWNYGKTDQEGYGVDLFSVAVHEFGHSLGLAHSSVAESVMFPYYIGNRDNFRLSYDDKVGIQKLYGPRDPTRWATLPPVTIPPSTTKNPRRPTRKPGPKFSPKPETCNATFDSISVIRGEVFAFKDKYFWRFDEKGMRNGYPVAIDRFWFHLPHNLKQIDAAYERSIDRKIVFFSGRQYWLFDANYPITGYPKPLTHLGLPPSLEKVDAAMIWGHNGKTYFFSGNQYWRYDEGVGRVELDYPRDMAMWRDIPYNIDAAFQWKDGNTYFFKGKYFWKFDDFKMQAQDRRPVQISNFWFGCPPFNENLPESHSQYSDNQNTASLDKSKSFIAFILLIITFSRWLTCL